MTNRFYFGVHFSADAAPAIYRNGHAGHEAGAGAAEEGDHVRYFLRLRFPAERMLRLYDLWGIRAQPLHRHLTADRAGTDGVHPDVFPGVVDGQRPRHGNHTPLGRGVGHLPVVAV